jgi:hypothetical protein
MMQSLDLNALDRLFEGHVDLRKRPGAVQPVRFPVAEQGFLDPFTRWVSATAAGVRLRLITDALRLRLATAQRHSFDSGAGARPSNYDLFVDGVLWRRARAQGGARLLLEGGFEGDENAVIDFDDLPAGEKRLELWLPQDATVSITALELNHGASWTPWPDTRRRIVFHGSSISHCMEAEGGSGA